MSETNLETEKLELERRKLRADVKLRLRELRLKERAQTSAEDENRLKQKELSRSRWTGPVAVAVVGGLLGVSGNIAANYFTAREQRRMEADRATATENLEKEKAEAQRILEVIKAGDPDKAATNLQFLLDSQLITDPTTKSNIQAYLENRDPGKGASLPAATNAAPVRRQTWQPLPPPTGSVPFHMLLDSLDPLASADITKEGKMTFHVAGNVGGVMDNKFEFAVAKAMSDESSFDKNLKPRFLYILGNVVFFDGRPEDYAEQFYLPFEKYPAPIFAIPGNHDGEIDDDSSARTSLDGFMKNFCSPADPNHQAESATAFLRKPQHEPNPYWTLVTPVATIIGLYTNVPAGGTIDEVQAGWLRQEMAAAASDRPLILALHHSPYSFDDYHSGSARMGAAIADAINASKRIPNAVLSATVMNYQRIEVKIGDATIPFFNIGSGGYHNLHKMNVEVPTTAERDGAMLVSAEWKQHVFATFQASPSQLSGYATRVPRPEPSNSSQPEIFDKFSYPGKALFLHDGQEAKL